MAYNKKTWKNRVSDYPTRRLITPVGQGDAFVAEIERNEGTITEEGDPFNAATMNDLENRIEQGIGAGSAIIAGIESTSTASRAYSVNQFLVYNNKLYRVIAAIAQGASLVPNTNISETTVGAQLTSIIGTNNTQTSSINTLNGQLTYGGTKFYFDYKNGKWGWNSSAARGADTFHPFRSYFTPQLVHSEDMSGKSSFTISTTAGAEYVIFMSGSGYREDSYINVSGLTINQKLVNPTNAGFNRWTFGAIIIGQATGPSITITADSTIVQLDGGTNALRVYQIAD